MPDPRERHPLDEGHDSAPFIAILTSERATIQDPEVHKLADGIMTAQKREIGEMIKRLEQR